MRRIVFAFIFLLMPGFAPGVLAGSAADDLAQKFAVEESKSAPAKPSAQRPAAKQQAQAQTAPDPKAAAPAPVIDKKAEEQEMLAAARAEAEARKAAEKTAPVAPPPAPVKVEKAAAPAAAPVTAANSPAPPAAPSSPNTSPRATILVVQSQHESDGVKTFDPIICFGNACFVSTGIDSGARAISRDEALSTKNTISAGAGACAGQMGCIFRGVSFAQGAPLQVIDLGIASHTAHEPLEARIDTTCAIVENGLMCKEPLATPDYRVWIVPEITAAQIGPDKLVAALDDELPEENVTLETDK